jgi:hypothetical protein
LVPAVPSLALELLKVPGADVRVNWEPGALCWFCINKIKASEQVETTELEIAWSGGREVRL